GRRGRPGGCLHARRCNKGLRSGLRHVLPQAKATLQLLHHCHGAGEVWIKFLKLAHSAVSESLRVERTSPPFLRDVIKVLANQAQVVEKFADAFITKVGGELVDGLAATADLPSPAASSEKSPRVGRHCLRVFRIERVPRPDADAAFCADTVIQIGQVLDTL